MHDAFECRAGLSPAGQKHTGLSAEHPPGATAKQCGCRLVTTEGHRDGKV